MTAEELSEAAVVRARFQTANLYPRLGRCIALDQIHHDAPEDGEILRGIVYEFG